jgi:hypothetical protein
MKVPYELRPGACDTGIVQATSVSHDDDATVREAQRFYADFGSTIEAETRALHTQLPGGMNGFVAQGLERHPLHDAKD